MMATNQPVRYGNIHLGKGCFIGLNVTILPGVHIGEGAVIGSCALVTKDIPAWTIATGVPAKVVRSVEA
jgi:acetyltransferase-like isoleucine patch superfamily enzyme